jgi:hypothetical protein
MSRRDWWLGIVLVVVALFVHAAFPRYEVRPMNGYVVRVDRWTGTISKPPRARTYLDDRGETLPPGQTR